MARSVARIAGCVVADGHPDPHEHAGGEELLVVVEHPPQPQGAGGRIEPVVDEIDRALVRDTCRPRRPARGTPATSPSRADFTFPASIKRRNRSVARLVDVEVGVHGVQGDHRGEDRVVGHDQVARIDVLPADAAADGGRDAGQFQVEIGGVQGRFGHLDRRLRLVAVADGLVVVRLADRLRGDQVLGPLVVGLHAGQVGAGPAPGWPTARS